MRKLILLAALIAAPLALAAQAPSNHDWSRVQALKPGITVAVKTKAGSTHCKLTAVTEEGLTCTHDKPLTFARVDVTRIVVTRPGRSTLAGLGIGAAGGALIGAAVGRNGSFVPRGAAAAVLAIPGALIGAIVGVLTDFTHSTIYKTD